MRKKVFAFLSFIAAVFNLFFVVFLLYSEYKTNNFKQTTAVIKQLSQDSFTYAYNLAGKNYQSDKITILDYYFSEKKDYLELSIFKDKKVGDKITCFYNRDNPSISILRKGIIVEKYLLSSVVMFIIFLVIGVGYWKDPVVESCGLG